MKKSIIIVLSLYLVTLASHVFSQDQVDALRFSQRFLQADARSAGSGNAFGAIGANFISTSINPAGMAFYRSSEFSFSLDFSTFTSKGTYLGSTRSDQKYSVNIPEVSLVFTNVKKVKGQPVKEGWASTTFALGINRTNNFNSVRAFEGNNTSTSILSNYVEAANGISWDKLKDNNIGGLAWATFCIDTVPGYGDRYRPIFSDTNNINVHQQMSVRSRGSENDINITLAGNYSNKLYIGGTISIPTIGYHETRIFQESNLKTNSNDYISHRYERDLDISGVGFQAMFGVIYKPVKYVRIGGSIQSPAVYNLNSTYNQKITSVMKWSSSDYEAGSEGNFNFSMHSPFKATASLGILVNKYGFIGIDYEFVDYSLAFFNSDVYSYMKENNRIENSYGPANNLRIGGEYKFDIFAIRAGYNIYGSPYNSEAKPIGADGSTRVLSFGLGVREEDYFFDVAYQVQQSKEFILPYSLKTKEVSGAVDQLKRSNLLFTFGLRF